MHPQGAKVLNSCSCCNCFGIVGSGFRAEWILVISAKSPHHAVEVLDHDVVHVSESFVEIVCVADQV